MKQEVPTHETPLEQLTRKLHSAFRQETKSIIEIGRLLIESRKYIDHGDWQYWLDINFDLSYRSAVRYLNAATYAESKSATVAHLENLAPTLLYALAEYKFTPEQETKVLDAPNTVVSI